MSFSRIIIIASICLGLTAAAAQPPKPSPAPTVPHPSMDGSINVPMETATTLFNGVVPTNGFMVSFVAITTSGTYCVVNDNGPANGSGITNYTPTVSGFLVRGDGMSTLPFITPPGYKPMGPANIWCNSPAYVAARGW